MTAKRGGLGKGLDSLIKENKTAKHTAPVKKEVVKHTRLIALYILHVDCRFFRSYL